MPRSKSVHTMPGSSRSPQVTQWKSPAATARCRQGTRDFVSGEGVVFTTFHDAKLLINRVVADHFDPISKEPEYKVTAVSLRKVMV